MGDVLEYIVDGASGLASGSVGGCIVAGVCSKGEPGKAYLLGNRSDVVDILGEGVLTTRIQDMFMTGGQNPLVIAVPVETGTPGTISNVNKSGEGAAVTVSGTPLTAGEYLIEIVTAGARNVATFTLNGGSEQTVPYDGILPIGSLTVTFADGDFEAGDTYTFMTTAPSATIVDIMEAIEKPLELYDVEFVYITGASDATAWAAAQAKAEELFNLHRPTYFKLEARLPGEDEDINDWTAALIAEKSGFAGRWVQVCAGYGTVTDSKGISAIRNWAGLQAGKTMAIPVQRAHGRVRDGNISQGALPVEWNTAVQSTLETAGYLTAKTYAGLSGAYWGDSRTLADSTSDYQYEEVVRITFKALRLSRQAALKSMYDELGDPVYPSDMTGAIFLQTNIETALDTMTKAIPKEMAAYAVVIPPGQDFVNNGVALELTFIGIPIIRQIKLFANYTYAGSKFDPRLKEA
jgi:hypothetical protein